MKILKPKIGGIVLIWAAGLISFFPKLAQAIEEIPAEVIDQIGPAVIKRTAPHWVVEIELPGKMEDVGNQAFKPLVDYIGGANQGTESISMTAPVNQQNSSPQKIAMTTPVNQVRTGADSWRVSFVLPQIYNTKNPPLPLDSRLNLRKVPSRNIAVLRYSGTWSADRFNEHRALLEKTLTGQSKWTAVGAINWARFDPPFMPWFLRRNEVQQEVIPAGSDSRQK